MQNHNNEKGQAQTQKKDSLMFCFYMYKLKSTWESDPCESLKGVKGHLSMFGVEPKHRTGSQIADAEVPPLVAGRTAALKGEKPNDPCGKRFRPPAHILTQVT